MADAARHKVTATLCNRIWSLLDAADGIVRASDAGNVNANNTHKNSLVFDE